MSTPDGHAAPNLKSWKRIFRFLQRNPQMGLSTLLFCAGGVAINRGVPVLAGALFGAGASLLGSWINDLNSRRTSKEEKAQREADARRYLAPELYRTIERVLYIHSRAIPNFSCASNQNDIKPNDLKEDFLPYRPALYPSAPQFRDLPGDEAVLLISFYDSLHSITEFVNDWWAREGQLPVNIFNLILHRSNASLNIALSCIETFGLEEMFPPKYESWGTITSRIERSLELEKTTRQQHQARSEAQNGGKTTPPRRR